MNISRFVGASSTVLLAWLGATYLHEVPPERYPKLDHPAVSANISEPAVDPTTEWASTQD